jgi:DNA modification methylase
MNRDPYWHDATSALYVGDARDVLVGMPGGSADCLVTSPPYWGKRDYGVAGQYGREPDPGAYVATLRAVFAEARRVLADDGTCWLNLGDSYSAGGGAATGMHAYLNAHLTAYMDAYRFRRQYYYAASCVTLSTSDSNSAGDR